MKKWLLAVIQLLALNVFAQCGWSISIFETGSGCLGADTLRLAGVSAAAKIEWYQSNALVKTNLPGGSEGLTVAGGNGGGSGGNQFSAPSAVFVDRFGNLFISDRNNHRIQRWNAGASSGTTVAGGNGAGSALNQCLAPLGVYVDSNYNIYPAESFWGATLSSRAMKWAPAATSGAIVAGGNGLGSGLNQLAIPVAVWMDASGNLYVSDQGNNRVQKWLPGATTGITVAGGNGSGSAANQLNNPCGIFVDGIGTVYIADRDNNRIQKWTPGASSGITLTTANTPTGVFVDKQANVYITEASSNRVQCLLHGTGTMITIAGQANGTAGTSALYLSNPQAVFVTDSNALYVADAGNQRIQKFTTAVSNAYVPLSSGYYAARVTDANGCVTTTDSIYVGAAFTPSVNISASITNACTGTITTDTFRATPIYGGSAPTYQWYKNGVVVGTNSSTLILSNLNNNDSIWVIMTSNLACSSPATVASNRIRLTVVPPVTVTVSASIPSCLGAANITVNSSGGTPVSTKWICDGLKVDSSVFSTLYHAPISGSYTAMVRYATGCTYASNSVTVQPSAKATVTISASANAICGTPIMADTFRAAIWSGGGAPVIRWFKNGVGVGNNSATFISSNLNANDSIWAIVTGSAVCATNNDTSNKIVIRNYVSQQLILSADSQPCTQQTMKVSGASAFTHLVWYKNGSKIYEVDRQPLLADTIASYLNAEGPLSIFVDNKKNVFVSLSARHQVVKWAPGATSGVRVAGDALGVAGSGAGQLRNPAGIFVDTLGNLYVCDVGNARVQKWSVGATAGVTVAGTGITGAGSDQLNGPFEVTLDAAGNLYVLDFNNYRIQKWLPGATSALTVAGGNGQGTQSNQLYSPYSMNVNNNGRILIADDTRIKQWLPGSATSTIVAGSQLGVCKSIAVDRYGYILAADHTNGVVRRYPPNGNATTPGEIVISNVSSPYGKDNIAIDNSGAVYFCHFVSGLISRYIPGNISDTVLTALSVGNYQVHTDFNGSCSSISNLLHVDSAEIPDLEVIASKYVFCGVAGADTLTAIAHHVGTNPVYQWYKNNIPTGTGSSVFIDQNVHDGDFYSVKVMPTVPCIPEISSGSVLVRVNHLPGGTISYSGTGSNGVITLIDSSNAAQIVWQNGSTTISTSTAIARQNGVVVAGTGATGTTPDKFNYVSGITVDPVSNVFVSDNLNSRVMKWTPGATSGTQVAGGASFGSGANQLWFNYGLCFDKSGSLYIADYVNHRVMKYLPGSGTGVVVAGGNGPGLAANKLWYPTAVLVDSAYNIYVSEQGSNRIQKWAPGATQGITVAGGNGDGSSSVQLSTPMGIAFDKFGFLYVSDWYNNRVQRFPPNSTAATPGFTVAGHADATAGSGPSDLNTAAQLSLDNYGNIYLGDYYNNRVQMWAPGATAGITVAGGNGMGLDSNQTPNPIASFVDTIHRYLYVGEGYYNRVQRFELPRISGSALTLPVSAPGCYHVQITDFGGCASQSDTIAIGQPATTVTVSTDTVFCQGAAADTFRAVVTNGGTAISYQWYKNGIPTGTNSPVFIGGNWNNQDSVWVKISTTGVCHNRIEVLSNKISISIQPVPVVLPTSNSPVAPGSSINLLSHGSPASNTYVWSGPAGYASTTENPTIAVANATMAGTYTVTATAISGCTATGSVSVNVNCQVTLSNTVLQPTCASNFGSVTLQASNGTPPYQYQLGENGSWTAGTSFSNLSAATDTFYVKDFYQCRQRAIVVVQAPALPHAAITPAGLQHLCNGDSLRLTAQPLGQNYLWNTGAVSAAITVQSAGIFWVSVTDSNGCTGISDSAEVSVWPLPALPVIARHGDSLFVGNASGYQWLRNGVAIPGATGNAIAMTQNGGYAVAVMDQNGCYAVSQVLVISNVGIHEAQPLPTVGVTPNPFSDHLMVTVSEPLPAAVLLRLTDLQGRVVAVFKEADRQQGAWRAGTETLADGVYLISGTINDRHFSKRVVCSH